MTGTGAELALFEALEEGVVAIDEASRIVFFNRSAEHMFGYASAEVIGQSLELLIPEVNRQAHRGLVDGFRRSGQDSRKMRERNGIAARRRDGRAFDAEASIARTRIDGREVLLAIVRDVTDRKRAEAHLRALEQRQRAILETCADAIVLTDACSGRVIDANSRAAALFGRDLETLTDLRQAGLQRSGRHAPPGVEATELQSAATDFDPYATVTRPDGTVIPVEITGRTTEIDGRPTLVEFLRDISYHKERERELVDAREAAHLANESKSRFLANMSHELRTPLNAVIGMSEMIRQAVLGPLGHAKYLEYATDIHDSGRHLLDLINDVLDLSRIELDKVTLHDEEIDVGDLIAQCRRTVAGLLQQRGLDCKTGVGAPAAVFADRRATRQMLLNLMSNAIKHTPDGGCVSITTGPGLDGGMLLTVADTGSGIPPERLAAVTEPFNLDTDISVSRQGGTGLGLTITKRLIERHGGQLLIDSRVGEGTSVHLVFPAERVRPAGTGEASGPGDRHGA